MGCRRRFLVVFLSNLRRGDQVVWAALAIAASLPGPRGLKSALERLTLRGVGPAAGDSAAAGLLASELRVGGRGDDHHGVAGANRNSRTSGSRLRGREQIANPAIRVKLSRVDAKQALFERSLIHFASQFYPNCWNRQLGPNPGQAAGLRTGPTAPPALARLRSAGPGCLLGTFGSS